MQVSHFTSNGRLLVFGCHEAWIYQLRSIGQPLDIVVDLAGRSTTQWDSAMRPVPPNGRCISLQDVLSRGETYDCIIAHNLTDLLDAKSLQGPRILVIHCTLGSTVLEQQSTTPPDELRRTVAQYVHMVGAHVVAVSRLKAQSWGLEADVVPFGADPAEYAAHVGDLASGLRIANQISRKRRTLKWDFHEKAFEGLPFTLVGRNDDMTGIVPARNWEDLKQMLRRHRFFVHTAEATLEDGYNMASLEAMAAGLPVLSNRHPTSPVRHGISGFLSDDPVELRAFGKLLLDDGNLAKRMGEAGRQAVAHHFSVAKFRERFANSICTARKKWKQMQTEVSAGASV